MKICKRIIVIFLAVLLIAANVGGVAFASEAVTTQQENLTYDADQNNSNQMDSQTIAEGTALSETGDGANADSATDAQPTEEGQLLVDGYEVYIDEQGQVFYLEKEPEEPVITEVKEEEPEVEVEAATPKKVEKAAKPSYSEKDLRLLACLVYAEAGNQSYKGMLAVANVVLNRVKSPVYSHCNTIKEVIYDKKWSVQFAVTVKSKKTGLSMLDKALAAYDSGKFTGANPEAEKKAMNKAIKAAKAALEGENNIGNYLCFNAVNKSTSRIKKQYPDYKIIGGHIFYRTK
jgi:spore germination cell wall hydrolase CwlJ-like protein